MVSQDDKVICLLENKLCCCRFYENYAQQTDSLFGKYIDVTFGQNGRMAALQKYEDKIFVKTLRISSQGEFEFINEVLVEERVGELPDHLALHYSFSENIILLSQNSKHVFQRVFDKNLGKNIENNRYLKVKGAKMNPEINFFVNRDEDLLVMVDSLGNVFWG